MRDKVFFDSNVLIYCYSKNEPSKKAISQTLIVENYSFISTQVLQEVSNTMLKKYNFTYKETLAVAKECLDSNNLYINSERTVLDALRIGEKYQFSFYDCMIISAALDCGCNILYTEDMQDGQVIDGVLTIVNPFV